MSIKVNASVLCADFTKLESQIKMCEDAGVEMIHVDVMDGHFVPNITIGPVIVEAIRRTTKLPIEAHLMIENPGLYIKDFISAGSDIISLQVECYGVRTVESRSFGQYPKVLETFDAAAAARDIAKVKAGGNKVFLVANPATPLCFDTLLKDIDGVLMMSVNPGFAKQKFMPEILAKIKDLRARFAGDIEVDGGVNAQTAPDIVQAGANLLVSASYFFGSSHPQDAVKFLKSLSKRF
jgi:ribulose-phosphate 3-epimerase